MHCTTNVAATPRFVCGWEAVATRLESSLLQTVQCATDGLGHLEERLADGTRELQRHALERAAQAKADATPPLCPVCGHQLTRRRRDHPRTVTTRFSTVTIRRTRGWCARCRRWFFSADAALRLDATSTASPAVQEAAPILERLTGIVCHPATLEREARRQGERGQAHRTALNAVWQDWDSLVAAAQGEPPNDRNDGEDGVICVFASTPPSRLGSPTRWLE